ncbi:spore germination protein [Bacillus sp. FJAT-29790]|uniref:spore germination protein n=1 Tax=Bacillus sp. FJAT-29790 TaxID=1895002 RepID=UPI001C21EABB|nr:spore germination protein [Bacillus sp. FJAT-29790]MBU8879183.1 spore germination protein [Bacillus sp. FJAT-29790]
MADNKMKNKMPIPESVIEIEKYMEDRIGLGDSFDLGIRKLKILRKDVHMYYVNGLTDTQLIVEMIEELVAINDHEKLSTNLFKIIENRLVHDSVEKIKTMDELVDQVLSGLIVVVVEGETTAFVIDVRSYPGRTPMEPDTEKVIRGSRDGFVENIIINTALTRRRIKDERLRFEMLQVGERSKTDVALGYIKDLANPDLLEIIRNEIEAIEIDGIPMADKTIEEFIVKQGYNPYPQVRYTERPDVAATHLLEGHVIIYVDTSPSVIITPTTFFYHLTHAEEYRQSPAVGTFERWIRYFGVIASLFLLPLWFLFVLEPSLLPERIAFIGPNEETNVPVIIQLFVADAGIDFLRMAAIHTPTPLATAMGLIAAVLIGQIAIDVGLFVPEVILYVALATIGSFTTPSYELSVANKMVRLSLLVVVALFHAPGLVIGFTVFIIWLASQKAMNTPYLWPFIPFYPKALLRALIRPSVPGSQLRPSINHSRDRYKQPAE